MTSKSSFITFLVHNIGIYFLYAMSLLIFGGIIFSKPVDVSIAFFYFLILITSIKIILTCYSIYSTRAIKLLKEKPIFLIPILLFDFCLISFFEKFDFCLLGFILSVTPCILICYVCCRINQIFNFKKIRLLIFLFTKFGVFFLGLLSLISLLGLFVNPENINITLSMFLSFFGIVFLCIFENLFFFVLCTKFKLVQEKKEIIQRKLCVSIVVDVLIYFVIACYILNNFNLFFTMYD